MMTADVVIPARFRSGRYGCCRGPRFWNEHQKHKRSTPAASVVVPNKEMPVEIKPVWRCNMVEEFKKIQWAVSNGYGVVALDTEFPGAPYVPDGISCDYRKRSAEDHYAVMKVNVDRTKIIQIGLTLTDEFGNMPQFWTGERVARVVWEFNFSDFGAEADECSKESVALLKAQGVDFERNKKYGISSSIFAKMMVCSGLIGRSQAWITFQGGADVAYLLKMILMNAPLPKDRRQFKACVNQFFGRNVFDVKHMMTHCNLFGGLDKVATNLEVEREAGHSHQAGSDSLLTARVFQRIRQLYYEEPQALLSFAGKLHNFE